MNSYVHFQTTKFTEFNDCEFEGNIKFGFKVFDKYEKYYEDRLTFEELKGMTPQKALDIIERDYELFYEMILDKGFYFNGEIIKVDESGVISF